MIGSTVRHDTPQVFLSGPIEKVDDFTTWREKTKRMTDIFEFVDPTDLNWVKGVNDTQMVEECKRLVRESDGVLIRHMSGQNTCGTWHEQQIAWQNNIPVTLVTDETDEEMFRFAKYHTMSIVDNIEDGLEMLAKRI